MIRNLIKLGVLAIVTSISLNLSSSTINEMVIKVHQREKTIADAIMKKQVQEMLKEAEKQIEKVQEEEQIEIKQEEVQMKEPLPEKPKQEKVDKVEAIEVIEESKPLEEVVEPVPIEEPAEVEEQVEGAATDAQLDVTTYAALTEEDMLYVGEYLVEHYFLFGYEYYNEEEDPILYERKKLASDMEDGVITSLNESFKLIKDMKNLSLDTLKPLTENAKLLAENFKENYKDVGMQGEEFDTIYKSINGFMDTYISTLEQAESTFALLEETTNKALILPMLLKSMNQDLLPSVKNVLNEGFALKEKTNKIYVEGMDDSFLITPDEVMDIIENPYSILPNQGTDQEAGQATGEGTDQEAEQATGEGTDQETNQDAATSQLEEDTK